MPILPPPGSRARARQAVDRLGQGGLFAPSEEQAQAALKSDHLAHGYALTGAHRLARKRTEAVAQEQGGLDFGEGA